MRFLSIAACALAASLVLTSPSQAIVVETHLGDPGAFHVYGPIPEPIEIQAWYGADVTWPQMANPESGYSVGATIVNRLGIADLWEVRSATGLHRSELQFTTFWISNEIRDIGVSPYGMAYGDFIINDVYVSFYLPDNLSIAAPVPEPSSWVLLILGFVGIALIKRLYPSRAGTKSSPAVAGLKVA